MKKQWCYSMDGESYFGNFDNKEDAIKEGREEAVLDGRSSYWIGTAEKTFVPSVDVDYLIERLQDRACEEGGEFGEGYLDNVTTEQEQELEEKMNDVLNEWIEKYKLEANFFSVAQEIEIHIEQEI